VEKLETTKYEKEGRFEAMITENLTEPQRGALRLWNARLNKFTSRAGFPEALWGLMPCSDQASALAVYDEHLAMAAEERVAQASRVAKMDGEMLANEFDNLWNEVRGYERQPWDDKPPQIRDRARRMVEKASELFAKQAPRVDVDALAKMLHPWVLRAIFSNCSYSPSQVAKVCSKEMAPAIVAHIGAQPAEPAKPADSPTIAESVAALRRAGWKITEDKTAQSPTAHAARPVGTEPGCGQCARQSNKSADAQHGSRDLSAQVERLTMELAGQKASAERWALKWSESVADYHDAAKERDTVRRVHGETVRLALYWLNADSAYPEFMIKQAKDVLKNALHAAGPSVPHVGNYTARRDTLEAVIARASLEHANAEGIRQWCQAQLEAKEGTP
jgi:hypothetical protein